MKPGKENDRPGPNQPYSQRHKRPQHKGPEKGDQHSTRSARPLEEELDRRFAEMRRELKAFVQAQMRQQQPTVNQEELRTELREKTHRQLRKELREEVRKEVRKELRTELLEEMREETRDELREEMRQDVREELRAELRDEVRVRLAEIARRRAHLDPGLLLQQFADRAYELLHKADLRAAGGSREQINAALRQAVQDAFRNRRRHLSHLTKIESLVRAGGVDQLPQLLDELFIEAGIRKVSDPQHGARFFAAENDPGAGPYLQVTEPAYVDEFTGQPIRAGRLRHVADPPLPAVDGGGAVEREGER
ncbi:hypothetical protein [Thermomonospora amylolytica]|uniref:hypothetical protein n=1 Tax=Thermomonospora amylolytica TaxID=1411117 RepID=UPI000E6C2F7D|nr:hypothetical protein [Thermomonospora amylolytica]